MSKLSDSRPGLDPLAWARFRMVPGRSSGVQSALGISYDAPRIWVSALTGASLCSVDLLTGVRTDHSSLASPVSGLGGYVEAGGTLYALASVGTAVLSNVLYRNAVSSSGSTVALAGWSQTSAAPTQRAYPIWCAEPNGDLLRIGGNPTATATLSASTLKTIERYSRATNTWTPLSVQLPFGAAQGCRAVYYAPDRVAVLISPYWTGTRPSQHYTICFIDLNAQVVLSTVDIPTSLIFQLNAGPVCIFSALADGRVLLVPTAAISQQPVARYLLIDPLKPAAEWVLHDLRPGFTMLEAYTGNPQSAREVLPGVVFAGDTVGNNVGLAVFTHTGL